VLLPHGQPDAPGERFRRWLEAGAAAIGVAEGATPDALKPLRDAIDAELDVRRAARDASEAPWRAWVAEGAERAPSGSALWLDEGVGPSGPGMDPSVTLPEGFAWTRAAAAELGRLPTGGYRFVVADADVDARDLVRLLDEGGVAVARIDSGPLPGFDDAQVIDVAQDGERTMVALRRTS